MIDLERVVPATRACLLGVLGGSCFYVHTGVSYCYYCFSKGFGCVFLELVQFLVLKGNQQENRNLIWGPID